MVVEALRVALPNLDQRPVDGLAVEIEHAAFQMQHRTHRLRLLAAHPDEVVVHVRRKGGWIERAFGLLRRGDQAGGLAGAERQKAGAGASKEKSAGGRLHGAHPTSKNGGPKAAVFVTRR